MGSGTAALSDDEPGLRIEPLVRRLHVRATYRWESEWLMPLNFSNSSGRIAAKRLWHANGGRTSAPGYRGESIHRKVRELEYIDAKPERKSDYER